MERDQYKTVTSKESFAILIPASPEEAIGEATFEMELGSPRPVRAVTLQELKNAAMEMKGADAAHFFALLALRGALEAGDKLALDKAIERMEGAYRLREAENPRWTAPEFDRQAGEVFAPLIGLPPEESLKYLDGLRPGPRAGENPSRLLSYEVSKAVGLLGAAQIVLWWVDRTFRPAIYCTDKKTALYIHTFFIVPTGGIGFRICPHCSEQFFQDRPNQDYCCPAHREAHRVARFRNEQKLRATNTQTNRRTNVTQKAR
jgi:hypothetical protein